MKSLRQFIVDSYEAAPATGMGPVAFPDVATDATDVMSPGYKHGSGDILNGRGRFLTVSELKRLADKVRKKKKEEQE